MSQSEILNVLKKVVDDKLAEEGITQELIDYVMLEVEYSPVIAHAGGRMGHEVEVKPYGFFPTGELPDRFDVPGVVGPVDRESLKVMRLRYLLRSKEHMTPWVNAIIAGLGLGDSK